MIETIVTLYRFVTYNACIMTLLLILQVPSYAQGGPYSTVAQRILDSENSFVQMVRMLLMFLNFQLMTL